MGCGPSTKSARNVSVPSLKAMRGPFSSSSAATAQPQSWELDKDTVALYYFDRYGRGEVVRLLLTFLDIDFDDRRVSKKDWEVLKSRSDFDQCPLLLIDDRRLEQPKSILRYLAQKHGLYPSTSNLKAVYYLESLCDLVWEMRNEVVAAEETGNPKTIAQAYSNCAARIPLLESRLLQNRKGTGWFIGAQISLADISVFEFLWDFFLRPGKKDKYENYVSEKLKKYVKNFLCLHTHVGQYLATRPQSKPGF